MHLFCKSFFWALQRETRVPPVVRAPPFENLGCRNSCCPDVLLCCTNPPVIVSPKYTKAVTTMQFLCKQDLDCVTKSVWSWCVQVLLGHFKTVSSLMSKKNFSSVIKVSNFLVGLSCWTFRLFLKSNMAAFHLNHRNYVSNWVYFCRLKPRSGKSVWTNLLFLACVANNS